MIRVLLSLGYLLIVVAFALCLYALAGPPVL